MPGRDAEETCTLGIGIIERLGGRAGKLFMLPETERVGDSARCARDVGLISPEDRERRCLEGPGMWLGVLGRVRGGDIVLGATVVFVRGRPGVCEREGGRYIENGVVEDCAVEVDVTGDHGREEAIELRERLRLYSGGTGGISSEVRGRDTDGLRGDCLTVPVRSSPSILVELFHAGRILSVELASTRLEGELSGVRLLLYLWVGRSGVVGVGGWPPLRKWNIDDL